MDKAVEVTREDFAAIRTGRAHPQMFHKITADYYGSPTPLQQRVIPMLHFALRPQGGQEPEMFDPRVRVT